MGTGVGWSLLAGNVRLYIFTYCCNYSCVCVWTSSSNRPRVRPILRTRPLLTRTQIDDVAVWLSLGRIQEFMGWVWVEG
jgi:hypothetical protein